MILDHSKLNTETGWNQTKLLKTNWTEERIYIKLK